MGLKHLKAEPLNAKSDYICTTSFGGIAQLARALAWHARGHRFDSDYLHKTSPGTIVKQWFQDFLFHFSPPLAHI
jgi:hypothetical protein